MYRYSISTDTYPLNIYSKEYWSLRNAHKILSNIGIDWVWITAFSVEEPSYNGSYRDVILYTACSHDIINRNKEK